MKRKYTPEEAQARNKAAKLKYYLRTKADPAYKAKRNEQSKARYHAKLKHDPNEVQKINERNLHNYHENIRTSPEKMEERRPKCKAATQRYRERKQEVKIKLQQVLGGKCVNCGITDPRLLDFDHIDPATKLICVSQCLHYDFDTLLEEIKKCQLLCPNCHRLKTYANKEQNAYKLRTYRNKYVQGFKSLVGDRFRDDNRVKHD